MLPSCSHAWRRQSGWHGWRWNLLPAKQSAASRWVTGKGFILTSLASTTSPWASPCSRTTRLLKAAANLHFAQAEQQGQAQALLEATQARLQAAQEAADGERRIMVEQQHQLAAEQQAMAAFRCKFRT